MTRRNTELMLLCIAAPLVILLFAMVALNEGNRVTLDNLTVPLSMFATFVVAHLAIRKLAPGADPAILPLSFALSGIGIAFITRLAPDLAMKQVGWLFLGVVFMVLVLAFVKNLDKLGSYKYTIMIAGILLLMSPMLPVIGNEIYGSRIWLSIGGFSIQPGELAKICIVIFLAAYLAQNREMLSVFNHKLGPFRVPDMRALVPVIIMWAVALLVIVFEKDLGSALVLFFVFVTMLYVATGKHAYIVISLLMVSVGFVFVYFASIRGSTPLRIPPTRAISWSNLSSASQTAAYSAWALAMAWPNRFLLLNPTSSSAQSPKKRVFWALQAYCFCTCASPSAAF